MNALAELVAAELARPVPPEVQEVAGQIVRDHGEAIAAILFYGSYLRAPDREGMLDFYVLVDDYRGFHQGRPMAIANALLPPNVHHREDAGRQAKLAVISRRAFARRLRRASLDTTIWARFCQPARLVHAGGPEIRDEVTRALAEGLATAAGWAASLGPAEGTARDYWTELFRHTYAAELRVEPGRGRASQIYESAAEHFDRVLAPALARAGIEVQVQHGRFRPQVPDRSAAQRAWRRRRRLGRALNLARLVKAAFTFAPQADYLAWKVERHTGRPLELTPFQRRHPVLAAPSVLWRIYRHRNAR